MTVRELIEVLLRESPDAQVRSSCPGEADYHTADIYVSRKPDGDICISMWHDVRDPVIAPADMVTPGRTRRSA